jgi:hypothetical protein
MAETYTYLAKIFAKSQHLDLLKKRKKNIFLQPDIINKIFKGYHFFN